MDDILKFLLKFELLVQQISTTELSELHGYTLA